MTQPAPAWEEFAPPSATLTAQELAVYTVLERRMGTVVSRAEIAEEAGISGLNARRCDSLIVGIRRRIGPDRILTVRRRGWMLTN